VKPAEKTPPNKDFGYIFPGITDWINLVWAGKQVIDGLFALTLLLAPLLTQQLNHIKQQVHVALYPVPYSG